MHDLQASNPFLIESERDDPSTIDHRQSSIDYHHLGRLHADMQEWEAARIAFESAVRRCPQNALYHQDLGRVLMLLRRHEEAGIAFGSALRLQPHHPQILLDVGVYLLVCAVQEQSLLRCREAHDIFHQVLRLRPDSVTAHTGLAHLKRLRRQLGRQRIHAQP